MIVDDSKKLILGLLSGLSLEQAKPFFLSLEKSGYRGDVCLFVRELGSATQAFLRARRVQLIPFPKAFLQRFSAGAARFPGFFLSREKHALPGKIARAKRAAGPSCAGSVYGQAGACSYGG